jgi:hypothetical protein
VWEDFQQQQIVILSNINYSNRGMGDIVFQENRTDKRMLGLGKDLN